MPPALSVPIARRVQALAAAPTDRGLHHPLSVVTDERPPLQAGEVRVGLLAMPINPADVLQLQGRYGHQPSAPFVPGHEAVGVVIEVGAEVSALAVGDWVMPLAPFGYWRDEWVLPARALMPLPPQKRVGPAAMLKANPATALVMLQHSRALSPGDWVLQNAANSAVGACVNAVAEALGLRVLNVVRRAQALPAEPGPFPWVVDDGAADLAAAVAQHCERPPLLGLDAIGGEASARRAAALGDGGTLLVYGLLSGEAPRVAAHDLVFRDISLRGFWLARWFQDPAHRAQAKAIYPQLLTWLAEGRFELSVAAHYPLQEVEAAVAHAQREQRGGKVLLTGAWLEALGLAV